MNRGLVTSENVKILFDANSEEVFQKGEAVYNGNERKEELEDILKAEGL